MGFSPKERVENALRQAKGNIEQAILSLTSEASTSPMEVDAEDDAASAGAASFGAGASSSSSLPAETGDEASASASAADVSDAKSASGTTAKSWRCKETGKLFRTMADVQMYAERTGRTDFEESSEDVKARTPEELKAAQAALKEKLAKKRKEREEAEKKRQIEAERKRRAGGKQAGSVKEEMLAKQRRRQWEEQRREKKRQQAERDRLRAEIAKDKAERKARGGKLTGKLGVDGYAPAGQNITAQQQAEQAEREANERRNILAQGGVKGFQVEMPREERLTKALKALGIQKARDAGKIALKTATGMFRRILKDPNEAKFRSINLQNEIVRRKVTSRPGGMNLLIAAGFKCNEETQRLDMGVSDIDSAWIEHVLQKCSETFALLSN